MISQQSESTSFVGCRTELFAELSISQTYENEMSEYVTGPDPDTLPGYPEWSRLVESHYTISRECTKGPHLKEK